VKQRGRCQDAGGNYIIRSVIILTYCQIIVRRPKDGQETGGECNTQENKKETSSVYDCTVEDVE